jgi:hypothetical protein
MLLNHSPKSFIKIFWVMLLLIPCFVILLNIIVDPFWVFRIVEIKGFNAVRSQFINKVRMSKAASVCRLKPTAAIFGTSRAELGIGPQHPSLQKYDNVYNVAMAGSGIRELFQTLKHTYYGSGKRLKLAIIGLDFLMFNMNREKVVIGTEVLDYDENRLLLSEDDSCFKTFLYDIDSFLFRKATLATIHTLASQSCMDIHLANGQRDLVKNALHTGMPKVGHRSAFIANEKYYMEKIWTAGAEQRYCTRSFSDNTSTLDVFRDMVAFARNNGIELKFYSSPTHVRLLIAIREAGLWSQLEEVKRNLVKILKEDALQHPLASPFELWDFMTFNSVTTEAVPIANDKSSNMKWHWETSHFKKEAGDRVLDRLMHYQDSHRKVPDDFGVLLNANNVESLLKKLLIDSREYDRQYPNDVAEVRQTAIDTLKSRSGVQCTKAYELLQQGLNEQERGHEKAATDLFNKSKKLHSLEKEEAQKRKLPFKEDGFVGILEKAKRGDYERPLETWMAYQERGNARRVEGKLIAALNDYGEAIKREPKNTALQYLRGATRLDLKDYRTAIEDFNAILNLEPSNRTVQELLKRAQIDLKEREKAH